jgi:hypothetical protein
MMVQHRPMRWPLKRVVDWADASERGAWIAELRDHVLDLFVVGLDGTKPPPKRAWSRRQARESLLANKRVLDQMLYLAGPPLENWRPIHRPLPPPQRDDPPEIAMTQPSPFRALPRVAWSTKDVGKWLGYVEGQMQYVAALLLAAYPEGGDEHRRARWAVIRLRVFFEKLRVALAAGPMRA